MTRRSDSIRTRHAEGILHGNARVPDRSALVSPAAIEAQVPGTPTLRSAAEVQARGLLTVEDVMERTGWDRGQVTNRTGVGHLTVVAYLREPGWGGGRKALYDSAQVDALDT